MPGSPGMPARDETGRRLALVIASATYRDPTLQQLRVPGLDAGELAEILGDPAIGGFEVNLLLDVPYDQQRLGVARFCQRAESGDLLLLYLSCHGVLDDRGRLYYASKDTKRALLSATALSARWLSEQLEDCRAQRQILLLDCCHSGAFAKGGKGDVDLALKDRFSGHSTVVLTASQAMEYSFEGEVAHGEAVRSVFTHAVVDGLRSGQADRDKDGLVTVTDLYHHVYDTAKKTESSQTPELWKFGEVGDLLMARSLRGAIVEPLPLRTDRGHVLALVEAEELARAEAQENTRRETEERARLEAGERARLEAEGQARLEAEELARGEAQENTRRKAEVERARLEAEEEARGEAEERVRLEAEEEARGEAEERARLEAAERARLEAEEEARGEAEERARFEAAELARFETAERARLEAEEEARGEAEEEPAHADEAAVGRTEELTDSALSVRGDESRTGTARVAAGETSPDAKSLRGQKSVGDAKVRRDQVVRRVGIVSLIVLVIVALAFVALWGRDGPRSASQGSTTHATTGQESTSQEPTSQELVRTLSNHNANVRSVAVTPNGKQIVSGSWDGTVRVSDLASGRLIRTLSDPPDLVFAVAVTPDGRQIVSGGFANILKVWDLASGKLTRTLQGHREALHAVAISPGGKQIIGGSEDKTVRVWDLASGKLTRTLRGHEGTLNAVAISPDGKQIISGSEDKTVRVWELASGGLARTLQGHTSAVNAVAVTPDGKQIISGSDDKTVRVWDLAGGRLTQTLTGHTGPVNAVAVTPDGRQIISGSDDRTVRVWNV
ncbi:MAG TPA: caspase family protein, partial [Dermatophilaceae bacterium]